MRRAFLLGLICAPAFARAQLILDLAGPEAERRSGADAALRRTVTLVLRAEARGGALPDSLMTAAPLPPDQAARLVVDGKLPGDIPALALPDRINRRLPHKRDATLWAAVGDALVEIDPVRLVIHSIVPGVLPPELEDAR